MDGGNSGRLCASKLRVFKRCDALGVGVDCALAFGCARGRAAALDLPAAGNDAIFYLLQAGCQWGQDAVIDAVASAKSKRQVARSRAAARARLALATGRLQQEVIACWLDVSFPLFEWPLQLRAKPPP